MKWILSSPNQYKFVDDDDPRPAVKLKSKVKTGAPTIRFTPSWRQYEKNINQPGAADKFEKEREFQLRTDPKSARWEKSRRDWFQKQKHDWRNKEIAKLKEQGL